MNTQSKNCLRNEVVIQNEQSSATSSKSSLLTNVISNWIPFIANSLVAFILTPYIISKIGIEDFGIWTLAMSFVGFYGLLSLGVGESIMRYVPYYRGLKDQSLINETISTSAVIYTVVGLVILCISLLGSEKIAFFFKGQKDLKAIGNLALLIRIFGFAAAVECLLQVLDTCIRAYEKWVPANFVVVCVTIIRAVAFAVYLHLGYGLVQMGYIYLATIVLSLILVAILFIRYCGLSRLHFSLANTGRVRVLISFGVLSTISAIVYSLRLPAHNIIIGKILSFETVGIYGIGIILMKNIRYFIMMPVRVFWPRFAYLDGQEDHEEIVRFFIKASKFCAILASGLILAVFVMGSNFIRIWIGKNYEILYPVLMILASGYLIELSLGCAPALLGATGHQKAQAVIATIEGIFGFGLSIFLAKVFGLVGVAVGFLAACIVVNGIVRSFYVMRILKISVQRYFIDTILRPWLILGGLTFIAYYSGFFKLTCDWPTFILKGFILAGSYFTCSYFICLNSADRKEVNSIIRKCMNKSLSFVGISVRH